MVVHEPADVSEVSGIVKKETQTNQNFSRTKNLKKNYIEK